MQRLAAIRGAVTAVRMFSASELLNTQLQNLVNCCADYPNFEECYITGRRNPIENSANTSLSIDEL